MLKTKKIKNEVAEIERIHKLLSHKDAPYGAELSFPDEIDNKIMAEACLEAAAEMGFPFPFLIRGDREDVLENLNKAQKLIEKYGAGAKISIATDPMSSGGVAVILENDKPKKVSQEIIDEFVRKRKEHFERLKAERAH